MSVTSGARGGQLRQSQVPILEFTGLPSSTSGVLYARGGRLPDYSQPPDFAAPAYKVGQMMYSCKLDYKSHWRLRTLVTMWHMGYATVSCISYHRAVVLNS